MNKKIISTICAAAVVTSGGMFTSCSLVSQGVSLVRSVDLSQYPGLNALNDAQAGMMNEYSKSTKLILQSRLAAVEALVLDAEAVAANNKGASVYSQATKLPLTVKRSRSSCRRRFRTSPMRRI